MLNQAWQQLVFLGYEISLLINKRWWRFVSVWFATPVWVVISYRLERALFMCFGRAYGLLRILLLPILFVTQPWRGNCEIHYRANISKGLKILHPALGVVINGSTTCGEHLTLTGGNCIGGRARFEQDDITLGNHVLLGANAVILGPVTIGSHVTVGAGAVVIHDAPDHATLVGVPAKNIR